MTQAPRHWLLQPLQTGSRQSVPQQKMRILPLSCSASMHSVRKIASFTKSNASTSIRLQM